MYRTFKCVWCGAQRHPGDDHYLWCGNFPRDAIKRAQAQEEPKQ
jgi:hypothetical protein